MKPKFFSWFFSTVFCILSAYSGHAQPKIIVAGKAVELQVTAASASTIRISAVPLDSLIRKDLVIEDRWERPGFRFRSLKKDTAFSLKGYTVKILRLPLSVILYGPGKKLVQQVSFNDTTGQVKFYTGHGPLYGLGGGGTTFDRRGTYDEMQEGVFPNELQLFGSRMPVPFLIGTEGWALFFHLPYKAALDLRSGTNGFLIPRAAPRTAEEGALPIDLFITLSRSPEVIMSEYTSLIGKTPLPPKWALGYMQSHRTLQNADSLISEVKTFRDKKLSCDAMIYLGTGYAPNGWNLGHANMDFNPDIFNKPDEIIKKIHDDHMKVVLHVSHPPRTMHGIMKPSAADTGRDYAYNYWKWHLPAFNKGVDGWWPDEGDELPVAAKLIRHMLYYEGPLLDRPDTRPFSLHRTGYAGINRYGGWVWSGDVSSLWETLADHVQVGLNFSLSASAYWGTDIGGFVLTHEFTGELFARWFQYSAFTPQFRSHGRQWWLHRPWGWSTGQIGPLEISLTGPKATRLDQSEVLNPDIEPICKKYLELRYQLMPYLYTAARENYDSGIPIMRALWLHYPTDSVAVHCSNEYLWGRNMLVAPVTQKGVTSREVYLPEGSWYDFWTNRRYEGRQLLNRFVDLTTLPLYVRAGTVLPMDPIRQYVDEPVTEPTSLRIYPGADGSYDLYEDDGTSLGYQRAATFTQFQWTDKDRTLTIQPSSRSTLSVRGNRTYSLQLMGRQNAAPKTVEYKGEKVSVKL